MWREGINKQQEEIDHSALLSSRAPSQYRKRLSHQGMNRRNRPMLKRECFICSSVMKPLMGKNAYEFMVMYWSFTPPPPSITCSVFLWCNSEGLSQNTPLTAVFHTRARLLTSRTCPALYVSWKNTECEWQILQLAIEEELAAFFECRPHLSLC